MKNLTKLVSYLLAVSLIFVAVILAYIAIPVFGNKALIVRSGSMEPTIKTGDLIIVRITSGITSPLPNVISKYKVGEIIAFKSDKNPNILTTHKIVAKKIIDGKTLYQTMGDANKSPDTKLVAEEQIVGKSIFTLPKVGKLFAYAKTKQGFALLVLIPALLVIFIESTNLIKELLKIKRARRMLQEDPQSKVDQGKLLGPVGLRILLPFIVSVMFFHNSYAFFSDTAISLNNTFTAASVFPSPLPSSQAEPTPTPTPTPTPSPSPTNIANHLVINEVFYHVDVSHQVDGDANKGEWIEIYNPTGGSVNINGWAIEDNSGSETLPNISVPSNGFLILSAATETQLRLVWTIPLTVQFTLASGNSISNGLADAGDLVRLKDNTAVTVDQMSWGSNINGLNPAVTAVVSGHSSERDPAGKDTDSAIDFANRTIPTPGI